jgi:predicted PurR-regulated permease PerM
VLSRNSLGWATIGRVAVAALGLWVALKAWQIWLLLFLAVVVAAAILPAARWGDRHRLPRLFTVLSVYLVAAFVIGSLGWLLAPALAEQATQFGRQLPVLLDNIRRGVASIVDWGARYEVPVPALSADGWQGFEALGQFLVETTLSATAGVIGAVVGFFLVLILAAYLVVEAGRIGRGVRRLLPPIHRARAEALSEPVLTVIGAYIRGQAVVNLCLGAMIALGLALLGVPYALLLGTAAAVLNVVPFLGAPLVAVVGILAAFNISAALALWTALVFLAANLLEGKLLIPYFVGRATGLHPLVILLGLLIGAKLAGLIGALVAIPFLAGAWEVLRRVYLEPGDHPSNPVLSAGQGQDRRSLVRPAAG